MLTVIAFLLAALGLLSAAHLLLTAARIQLELPDLGVNRGMRRLAGIALALAIVLGFACALVLGNSLGMILRSAAGGR